MKTRAGLLLCSGLLAAVIASPLVLTQESPQRVEISVRKFAFTPGEVTLKKGQPVVIVLKSMDANHGLRIRDLGVDLKVKAGGTAEVTITPDKVGDFVGHCSVFCGSGHGSMTFTVHVVA
jgi:cytochrome c oxidase subunit II